jgi:hypothetical protein
VSIDEQLAERLLAAQREVERLRDALAARVEKHEETAEQLRRIRDERDAALRERDRFAQEKTKAAAGDEQIRHLNARIDQLLENAHLQGVELSRDGFCRNARAEEAEALYAEYKKLENQELDARLARVKELEEQAARLDLQGGWLDCAECDDPARPAMTEEGRVTCGCCERARADALAAQLAAVRDLFEPVEDYLAANIPGNSWGLLDKGADADREAVLCRVRAARTDTAQAARAFEERIRADAAKRERERCAQVAKDVADATGENLPALIEQRIRALGPAPEPKEGA